MRLLLESTLGFNQGTKASCKYTTYTIRPSLFQLMTDNKQIS